MTFPKSVYVGKAAATLG